MSETRGSVPACIGEKMVVEGEIRGEEDLIIAGRFVGTLHLSGRLQVEAGAVVKAKIGVSRADVAGAVIGDIVASESIHLASSARVVGDLRAPRIGIAEGARYSGKLEMGGVAETEIDAPRPQDGGELVLFHEGPTGPPTPSGPAGEGAGIPPASEPQRERSSSPSVPPDDPDLPDRPRTEGPRRKRIVVKKRS